MRSEEKKQEPVPDPEELLSYTVDGTRTHVPSRELADYIPVCLRTNTIHRCYTDLKQMTIRITSV